LIFDVLAVNPTSFAKRKADWEKVAKVYYKAVDYLLDEKTKEDAVKIMAAKVGADPAEYSQAVPGTHFLTLAEAKAAFKKGTGMESVYGSMTIGNKFNLENKVYKVSQKPESYLVPSLVEGLK
jgi:NitT/TauT family transport system substrate-binding protein